jgi:hypothetical protein
MHAHRVSTACIGVPLSVRMIQIQHSALADHRVVYAAASPCLPPPTMMTS